MFQSSVKIGEADSDLSQGLPSTGSSGTVACLRPKGAAFDVSRPISLTISLVVDTITIT
jgi:hypothetical protein